MKTKRLLSLALAIVLVLSCVPMSAKAADGIPVDEAHFPDDNFRAWILEQSYGADGVLTQEEIAGITTIKIYSWEIADLAGIEYFIALEYLNCYNTPLTSLDVSRNTNLEYLSCRSNQLTSLDVTKNTALVELDCRKNQLTSLDLSNNTALEILYCGSNQLTSLDLSNNTGLELLVCDSNQLTSLDLSNNTALKDLYCDSNQLTSLDLSNNTALEDLSCYSNQLTSLDLSNNTALKHLYCFNNQLTSLDVSQNPNLALLYCDGNQLAIELDESNQFDLSTLPGFDVTRASDWTGGTVNGNILTVENGGTYVRYTYQLNDSRTETFTLRIEGLTRESGENRFETATLVADEMKEVLDIEKFDAVILANGYNYADALAGSYLSTVKDAPILLTWNGAEKYNYLNDATIEYVKSSLKPGGTVYILGGTSAVPASIDARLSEFHVHRMAGANRFETNIMILEEAGVPAGSEILVCTSSNFADSLSASATGKPILLVWNDRGVLYGDQPKFLEELQAKGCTFTVIGGESAVSGKMAATVGEYGEVDRLAGANRFETSVQVAEKYFPEAESAVLAYAWDFPDGLCGGGLANAMNAPLILTMTRYETQAADYIQRQGIKSGIVLGGEGLISAASVAKIFGN